MPQTKRKPSANQAQIGAYHVIVSQCFSGPWFAPSCGWFAPCKSLQIKPCRSSQNIVKHLQIILNHCKSQAFKTCRQKELICIAGEACGFTRVAPKTNNKLKKLLHHNSRLRKAEAFHALSVIPFPIFKYSLPSFFLFSFLPFFLSSFLLFFFSSEPPTRQGGRLPPPLTTSWPPARWIRSRSDVLRTYFFRCQDSHRFLITACNFLPPKAQKVEPQTSHNGFKNRSQNKAKTNMDNRQKIIKI